jgi:hypothetical protein
MKTNGKRKEPQPVQTTPKGYEIPIPLKLVLVWGVHEIGLPLSYPCENPVRTSA